MNSFNIHLYESFSRIFGAGDGSRSNGALLVNLFLTTLVTAIYTPELHSLLVSAISWGTVAIVCWLVRKQAYRNGEPQALIDKKMRRKATALIGCILLSGICDRVVGPAWKGKAAWWNKAGLPLVTRFLRNHLLGDPGILEGAARSSKRLLALITLIAFLAMSPIAIPDLTLALGLSNVVFQSMIYVLMEDIASTSLKDHKNAIGAAADLKSLAFSSYQTAAVGAAIWLFISSAYFERPLDDYAKNLDPAFALSKFVATGVLGGLRLLCLPLLVSRMSSPSGSMVDLSVILVASQLTTWTSVFQLIGTIGSLILISSHFTTAIHNRELAKMIRPTRSIIAVFLILLITIPLFSIGFKRATITIPPSFEAITPPLNVHPIKKLMDESAKEFESMKQRQSTSLRDAIRTYKKRYGMSPPPNFDKWYEFAVSRKTAIIDEYDMIFHQLQPFWGMPPGVIRERAREALGYQQALLAISIRGGKTVDYFGGKKWQQDATLGLISQFIQWLPDMDLAFNTDDEPRVVVPSEHMKLYLDKARSVQRSQNPKNVYTGYGKDLQGKIPESKLTRFGEFSRQSIWGNSRISCPSDTPAGDPLEQESDARDKFTLSPIGFITNRTASMDVCLQPSLQHRYGLFESPNSFRVSHHLFPIFSQSKPSCFHDIIYPSPWYWAGNVTYDEEKDLSWDEKQDLLYWRGSTTGGYSRNSSWRRQHRQLAVIKLNDFDEQSQILELTQENGDSSWQPKTRTRGEISPLIDVKFSHIGQCDDADCDEQRDFFKPADMTKQQDAWKYKYLLDMDGNAFSGRFYAFLWSNSAVFKMGIFQEWHEEWLKPWVHYVPLNLDMGEATETLRYFTKEQDGIESIKRIADQGRYWAKRVLRKEDFEVWFFRLLLEYGRLLDDNRDQIGFEL